MVANTDREFDFRGFMRTVNRELFDVYARRLVRERCFLLHCSPQDQCVVEEDRLIYEAEIALKEHLGQFDSRNSDVPRSVDLLMKLLIEAQVRDFDIGEEEQIFVLADLLESDFTTLVSSRISRTPLRELPSEPRVV